MLKFARSKGYKGNDLQGAIRSLEKKYPAPSDGITSDFGGGLQHHLRDFAHHPSILGLIFSILTQFTGLGFGTDTSGAFQTPKLTSDEYMGKDFGEKVLFGVVNWAFHLISDMAGSFLKLKTKTFVQYLICKKQQLKTSCLLITGQLHE